MSIELHLGDCLEYMRTMKDKSVDAVITDPPYGIGIGGNGKIGGNGEITAVKQYQAVKWDDIGLTVEQFEEIKRLSKIQLIFGFEHLASVLGKAESVYVWDKKCQNGWEDNFSDCEIAWSNSKIPTRVFRHLWMGALRASEKEFDSRQHPTQKPVVVMKSAIERYTQLGDTIFDPFMGSGTTGVACVQTGRNFIGCEIDEGYFKIDEKRIHDAEQQMRLGI